MFQLVSILATMAYTGFLALIVMFSGMSDSSADPWTPFNTLGLISPFVYLGFCMVSSFRSVRGEAMLLFGVIAHLSILPYLWLALAGGNQIFGEGDWKLAAPALLVSGTWLGAYREKRRASAKQPQSDHDAKETTPDKTGDHPRIESRW